MTLTESRKAECLTRWGSGFWYPTLGHQKPASARRWTPQPARVACPQAPTPPWTLPARRVRGRTTARRCGAQEDKGRPSPAWLSGARDLSPKANGKAKGAYATCSSGKS